MNDRVAAQAKDTQQAESSQPSGVKESTAQSSLLDARPQAIAQRRQIEMANNGPRALQQSAFQGRLANSSRMVAQRAKMASLFGATQLKTNSTAPIQLVLDPLLRRLKAAESDWKKVLTGNGFSAQDIKKIEAKAANGIELAADFNALRDIDVELDGFAGSLLGASAIQKRKNRIKDRLEGFYTHIVDKSKTLLDEANQYYATQVNAAADAIRAFKARTDRTRQAGGKGNAYPAGSPLLKHEKDGPVKALIDACYVDLGWLAAGEFKTTVMARFTAGNLPLPALDDVATARLATEKTAINTQLTAWATVAFAANGTNADGTWGTSATGAGATFAVTSVSPAVWGKLRQWWSKKSGAFVTGSDTSDWSLKMDRNPDVDGLSPRINYHINVA